MKTQFKKTFFAASILLAALCAICVPENSSAQTPPDDSAQPAAPDALPADILPSSPLAEVVKLTQSGVSENVILSYITNSSGTFSLDSGKIIYLTNLGTPDEFVTAMMQHDQTLAVSGAQPAPPPAVNNIATDDATQSPAVAVTEDDFDSVLAPYGNWVVVEGYGRCWRPTATFYDTAWQPYSDHGHWIYTDAGWYWASDYAWGATFHYGRWFHHDRFGWVWYPDTVWAPSWVTWRYSDDYCGWAPLPPGAVYREGLGIFYNGVAVSAGFDFGLAADFFTFVPVRNFSDPHQYNYRVARSLVPQIYSRTAVINNFAVNGRDRTFVNNGIPPQRITAVTRVEIHPVAIRETTTPLAHGDQLGRSGATLFVNRPNFTLHPNPSAPRNSQPQNNFSQPAINRNSRPDYSRPEAQTQTSQFARPQTTRPVAPGTPVQTQPRQQIQPNGPPATYTHNPDSRQNTDTLERNQVGAPAVNNSVPATAQQPQNNSNSRQYGLPPGGQLPNQNEPPAAATEQPQAPPVQNQSAPASSGQKNSSKQGKNQNGQQQ